MIFLPLPQVHTFFCIRLIEQKHTFAIESQLWYCILNFSQSILVYFLHPLFAYFFYFYICTNKLLNMTFTSNVYLLETFVIDTWIVLYTSNVSVCFLFNGNEVVIYLAIYEGNMDVCVRPLRLLCILICKLELQKHLKNGICSQSWHLYIFYYMHFIYIGSFSNASILFYMNLSRYSWGWFLSLVVSASQLQLSFSNGEDIV